MCTCSASPPARVAHFRATLDKLIMWRNTLYHNQWDTSRSHMSNEQLQQLFTCVMTHLLGEHSAGHTHDEK